MLSVAGRALMEHLNYCRSLLMALRQLKRPSKAEELAMTLAKVSIKFQLPSDGNLLDDAELRALDPSLPLSLPFDVIALELSRRQRSVIFAEQFDDEIVVHVATHVDLENRASWMAHETSWRIPRRDYINRAEAGYLGFPGLRMYDSEVGWLAGGDNYWFQRVLLGFVNALACSNVRITESRPKSYGRKIKAALPFDTYHMLTIDSRPPTLSCAPASGSHRSPREHLRRGHIRRLADGRRIWVNATVVAAGRGAGVVSKDYALR